MFYICKLEKLNITKSNIMELKKNVYKKYIDFGLPLTDQLAAARTILANERTFLSYQRTALTLAVSGISFIHFFDSIIIAIIGWVFIPAALITMTLGITRYRSMRRCVIHLEDDRNRKS